MTESLTDLAGRVWRSVTQDAYDANDIGTLIDSTLKLEQTLIEANNRIALLEEERARFIEALEIAGKDNEKLRASLDKFGHLVQFAEEVVE